MNTTVSEIPELEPPGAGLPAPILFVARRIFSAKCRRGSREKFIEEFRAERAKVRRLVDSCPPERRGERVLVPRLRGLEDSSRYYSVWMTLDHLRMTNLGFEHLIHELAEGRKPTRVVSTADVKPDPAVTAAVDAQYEAACDVLLDYLARAPELNTELEHPHPWFGPLNAYRWLALSAMHMGIHRNQTEEIIKRLPT